MSKCIKTTCFYQNIEIDLFNDEKKQRIELTPKGELQYWAGGWDLFCGKNGETEC